MQRFGSWSPTLCLLLAIVGCSDEISNLPEPTPPGPEEPGPEDPGPIEPEDCHSNAHWDEVADVCVCDEGFELRAGSCVVPVPLKDCLLISSTDWATNGSLSVLDVETGNILQDTTTYHQDSIVRVINGEVFIVQRMYGDAVLKLDPSNNYESVWEESVRLPGLSAPNPHDMVRHGDHFYLSLYNDGRIVQANVNPITAGAFLTGVEARIAPPSWDGDFAELSNLRVVNGVLYGLAQGLGNDWACNSQTRSRIYAFEPATLTPAPVFEDGKTYKELNFCNATGWVPYGEGKVLVHSLGNYRSINGADNDGGLEIVDLANPTAGIEVVADEENFGSVDIFGAYVVGNDVYVTLIDENYLPVYLHKVDTSDAANWTLAGDSLYEGYIWGLVGIGDELFVVNRDYSAAEVIRINRHTGESSGESILTDIAPETLTLFQREGSCW